MLQAQAQEISARLGQRLSGQEEQLALLGVETKARADEAIATAQRETAQALSQAEQTTANMKVDRDSLKREFEIAMQNREEEISQAYEK